MRNALRAILRQLGLNRSRNLLHAQAEQLMAIDTAFATMLEDLLGRPDHAVRVTDMARAAAEALIERIHEVNQFVRIDTQRRQELQEIYNSSWERLRETGEVEKTLRRHHYPALRTWLGGVYPHELARSIAGAPRLGTVPCAEYTPELQMSVLRLSPRRIREPILDIGCGPSGRLTRYLRDLGLDAHGIDRRIDEPAPWLTVSDWLEYDYAKRAWGTVVSNLGITNHYVHTLAHDAQRAGQYEAAFGRILQSLAPGGSFHYAPAATRLEALAVPTAFDVAVWQVSPPVRSARITRRGEGTEAPTAGVEHV